MHENAGHGEIWDFTLIHRNLGKSQIMLSFFRMTIFQTLNICQIPANENQGGGVVLGFYFNGWFTWKGGPSGLGIRIMASVEPLWIFEDQKKSDFLGRQFRKMVVRLGRSLFQFKG